MEGGFGTWGDVGWCGWVLGGLRWPSRGFSQTWPSKESLQENLREDIGNLQEEKQHSTEGLEEEAESSFHCFEGVRVGWKGGWILELSVREPRVYQESLGERKMVEFSQGERRKVYGKCKKLRQNWGETWVTCRAWIRWRMGWMIVWSTTRRYMLHKQLTINQWD